MGLHTLSNEVHADFVGHPLSIKGSMDDGIQEVVIDTGERDDGVVGGQRVVLRGSKEQFEQLKREI